MNRPSLPEKLDNLNETQQSGEMELYRRRLVHYHYVKNTEKYNELHYAALADPMGMFRHRLFCYASDPWEGETPSEGCVDTSNEKLEDAHGKRPVVSYRVQPQ
jgi:hypothetical protein